MKISSVQEQQRILKACHSDATSGHFAVTKTDKRIVADVRNLVSSVLYNLQAGCQTNLIVCTCKNSLALHREQLHVPGISRLIIFSMTSMLTGEAGAYEQEPVEPTQAIYLGATFSSNYLHYTSTINSVNDVMMMEWYMQNDPNKN